MSAPSPTLEGFRAAFRRPILTFAEMAWRWAIGATTVSLFVFYGVEFLDTLPVTNADAALIATREPGLIGRAIMHILRGSLNRAVFAALLAALALTLMWIVVASFGRLVTVRALLAYFGSDAASSANGDMAGGKRPRPIRAMIDLSFFRIAVLLAMILSLGTAGILADRISTGHNPQPGLGVISFLFMAVLVGLAGWMLNWLLSMAGIFAARDGRDALAALSATVTVCRERTGAVLAISTWTGLAHLVAFSIGMTALSLPLAFVRVAPSRLVVFCMVLVMLAYFAVVDWLYIARLAGYVYMIEMPDAPMIASALPQAMPQGYITPTDTAVDRDEPILSDHSNFAVEM
jgi:hypothetical protein